MGNLYVHVGYYFLLQNWNNQNKTMIFLRETDKLNLKLWMKRKKKKIVNYYGYVVLLWFPYRCM